MKRNPAGFALNVILFTLVSTWCVAQNPRQHLLMDYNWRFEQSDVTGADKESFDDNQWRMLNLPHDWSIEGEFKEDATTGGHGGYLPTGIGWYRKHFVLPTAGKNQQTWVEFEGVYMNSDVWVNGHHLGNHPYGYTSFGYDLSPFLKEGENVIAVRVDNSVQPNSRWYSGSGIDRHVWLNIAGPVHVSQWGTYIKTPSVDSSTATVVIRTSIENNLAAPRTIFLRSVVVDASGDDVATVEAPVSLAPSRATVSEQNITISSPELWSTESPALYNLHSIILEEKKPLDELVSVFGIRSIAFDKDTGFLLNGKRVKMNGVCLHHDAGCLGAAVPKQAWERRLQLLKEMGCNAIRTSHNPPDPDFLDLCDTMGFLVMDEAFDEWVIAKGDVPYGYHRYFPESSQPDLLSIIHRDRNHPAVVLWSAGNEVLEQGVDTGLVVLRNLLETFHREDPTRPVTVANDHIVDPGYTAKPGFLEMQDVVGYNYVDRWLSRRELYYSMDKHDHPNWKMIGTESVSAGGVRGDYAIGRNENNQRPGRSEDYRSSMIRAEDLWKFVSVHDYVAGDFMWTGIDYLGEARWPGKSSSSGVIDLCGFPKDGYYLYQSQWTTQPMVHLFPHWNWAGSEGHVIPVIAYTNCDSVELFLNGKSFGIKCKVFPQQGNSGGWNRYARPFVNATTSDLHLSWDVPYEPGILKAVARKDGMAVITEVQTTGEPAAIRLSADRTRINADAEDIVNVKVEIIDDKGLVVSDADNLIEFSVSGEGTLAGTDNGNPQDRTSMKSNRRSAFNGLAYAVIRSSERAGSIVIEAKSEGLKASELQVLMRKPKDAAKSVEGLQER
jgi:beta-galactosidase